MNSDETSVDHEVLRAVSGPKRQRSQTIKCASKILCPRPVPGKTQECASSAAHQPSCAMPKCISQSFGFSVQKLVIEQKQLAPCDQVLGDHDESEPYLVAHEVVEGEFVETGVFCKRRDLRPLQRSSSLLNHA